MSALAIVPVDLPHRDFPTHVPDGFFEQRQLCWRSSPCAAGGHRFDVTAEGPAEIAPVLRSITLPLRAAGLGGLEHYRVLHRDHVVPYALYHEGTRLLVACTPEAVAHRLSWHINRQMIDKTCPDWVLLHSAAATRHGITVILPGDQEQGKTTTVAGLLRAGYDYVTDEAVAVDPETLWITPFPKALSLDEPSWPLFADCRPEEPSEDARQWRVVAERFGSRSLRAPVLPPRVIVFPRYRANARTVVTRLSPGEAVRELCATTFQFTEAPGRNLRVLGGLVAGATVARLQIGALDAAVRAVDQLLSETLIEGLCR